MKTQETIEVQLYSTEKEEYKQIKFTHNGFELFANISSEKEDEYVEFYVDHEKTDHGFCLRIDRQKKELRVSIDHNGFMTETKKRSYKDWIKLENLEKALKIVGNAFGV